MAMGPTHFSNLLSSQSSPLCPVTQDFFPPLFSRSTPSLFLTQGLRLLWQRKCEELILRITLCVLVAQLCLTATLWTVACHAPPSLGFSRQEYWSGLPFTSPGDLPNPGTEPRSPALQVDSTVWATREVQELL